MVLKQFTIARFYIFSQEEKSSINPLLFLIFSVNWNLFKILPKKIVLFSGLQKKHLYNCILKRIVSYTAKFGKSSKIQSKIPVIEFADLELEIRNFRKLLVSFKNANFSVINCIFIASYSVGHLSNWTTKDIWCKFCPKK